MSEDAFSDGPSEKPTPPARFFSLESTELAIGSYEEMGLLACQSMV